MVHSFIGKSPLDIIEGRPKVPPILRMHQNIFVTDEYMCDLQTSIEKIKDAIRIMQVEKSKDKGKSPLDIIEGRPKVPPILRMHQNIFATDEYMCDLQTSIEKIKDAIRIMQLEKSKECC